MHECTICYKRKKKFTVLDCKHELCTACWNRWKHSEKVFYKKPYPTCPTCRQEQIPYETAWNWKLLLLALLFWILKDWNNRAKTQQKV